MTIEQLVRFESLKDEFARLSEDMRLAEVELGAHLSGLPDGLVDRMAAVSEQLRRAEAEVAALDCELTTGGEPDNHGRWLAEVERRAEAKRPKVKAKRKAAEKVY